MIKKTKKISISTLCKTIKKGIEGQYFFKISPNSLPVLHNVTILFHHLKIHKNVKELSRFHNLFVLKIHLSGNSEGFVENNKYNFVPGEGILIFPFQMHKIISIDPQGQWRLIFNFSLSPSDQADLEPLKNKIFKVTPEDCQRLKQIVELACETSDSQKRKILNLLSEFLVELLARCKHQTCDPSFGSASSPGIVVDFLLKHYREGLSVKEIAARLGYSETSIRTIFHRETGRTPRAFMQELVLHDAAELLMHTKKNIQTISHECGFSNPYVFSRAFKNKIGESPKAFREKIKEKRLE